MAEYLNLPSPAELAELRSRQMREEMAREKRERDAEEARFQREQAWKESRDPARVAFRTAAELAELRGEVEELRRLLDAERLARRDLAEQLQAALERIEALERQQRPAGLGRLLRGERTHGEDWLGDSAGRELAS